jgi:peptide/nickel transport system substrate-binding protein
MKKFLTIFLSIFLLAFNAHAQRDKTLVIGMNISDGRTYDPSRQADTSTPLTIGSTYETLVTITPDNYENIKPGLANKWELVHDGSAWRFYIRDNAKFWNGSSVSANDVKFSYDRLKNLKDQPAEFTDNIDKIVVVDDKTLDIYMKDRREPLLSVLTTVSFATFSKKELEKIGGLSDVSAKDKDTATRHLNEKSYGSGPYRMTNWTRNEIVVLEKNKYWHENLFFDRIVIKHISDGAAQLLALRRGDIDIAFNLTQDQIELVKKENNLRIESVASLDYVYLTLTNNDKFNSALSDNNARLAIAHAIDYDGITKHLLGNNALRPVSILPIGVGGTTKEHTTEFGHNYDLGKARKYLSQSNHPNGFSFSLSFSTSPVLNINSSLLAQKIQSDLAKINIKVDLNPMDASTLVTSYRGGNSHSAIMSYTIDALDASLWTRPFVGRIAKRLHWTPNQNLIDLTENAAVEQNAIVRNLMYKKYQQIFVSNAHFINLAQPIYNVAVSNKIKNVQLTGAGWYINLKDIHR